jgi:hypothetical protein
MRKYEKFGGRHVGSDHPCDWPECNGLGEFRAPKINTLDQTKNLDEKDPDPFWFCLDHVRDYNASWDFFKNKTQDEIENWQSGNSTWHRPTWTFGNAGLDCGPNWEAMEVNDTTGVMTEKGNPSRSRLFDQGPLTRPLRAKDKKALKTLGMASTATAKQVKKAYKSLLKTLHPDIAGNDNKSANRLREVIEAYNHLKQDFKKA